MKGSAFWKYKSHMAMITDRLLQEAKSDWNQVSEYRSGVIFLVSSRVHSSGSW